MSVLATDEFDKHPKRMTLGRRMGDLIPAVGLFPRKEFNVDDANAYSNSIDPIIPPNRGVLHASLTQYQSDLNKLSRPLNFDKYWVIFFWHVNDGN